MAFKDAPASHTYCFYGTVSPRDRRGNRQPLRFSDVGLVVDNVFYPPRLLDAPRLSAAVRSVRELKPTISELTVALSGKQSWLYRQLGEYDWKYADFELYAIPRGAASSSYALMIYKGFVKYAELDGARLVLHVVDFLDSARQLPPNEFNYDDYSSVRDDWVGKPVPIVFGDFETDEDVYQIEAALIEPPDAHGNVKLKIADTLSPLGSLESIGDHVRILKGGTVYIGEVSSKYLGLGELVMTYPTGATYEEQDKYLVLCKGWRPATGEYSDNPVRILRWLMTYFGGLDDSWLDGDSFDAAESLVSYSCRYRLADKRDLFDVIADFTNEFGFGIHFAGSKLVCTVPRLLALEGDWVRFYASDLLSLPRVAFDPDGSYAKRIKARAAYDYYRNSYRIYAVAGSELGTDDPPSFEIEREFKLLYRYGDLTRRLLTLSYLFGQRAPMVFELELGHRAFDLNPLGKFWLQLPQWKGNIFEPFLALAVDKDFSKNSARVRAVWIGYMLTAGRWTSDEQSNYANSTDDERKYWGFWTDDSGLCDPSDTESDVSHWTSEEV